MSYRLNESEYDKKYLDAGGVNTCYIEAGSGDPLILIHGGGAGANGYGNWFTCLPLFARQFHVIAVDMLGFGKTAKPSADTFVYSSQARYQHLANFLKALDLGKANLVGNSMGGSTAIGVAVEYPHLVDKLILMGSAGLNAKISEALLPVVNYDFTKEGMRKLIKVLTNDKFEISQEMIDFRHASSLDPENRKSYGATMRWVKEQGGLFYADDFIRRVSQPTLVVNGKSDQVVTLQQAYRFLELIDNSWAYIVPHCGHWTMIEYPEDFTAAVTTFIRSH